MIINGVDGELFQMGSEEVFIPGKRVWNWNGSHTVFIPDVRVGDWVTLRDRVAAFESGHVVVVDTYSVRIGYGERSTARALWSYGTRTPDSYDEITSCWRRNAHRNWEMLWKR